MDIIIVNWNSGEQLRHCIESLHSSVVEHIIVVDNASSDGSAQISSTFPNVILIQSPDNLGFGKACNLGASYAKSNYFLFLNPDAAVYENTLEKSLQFMQEPANSGVGICGVQLEDEMGHVARSCSRFPTALSIFAHSSGLTNIFPYLGSRMLEWSHDKTLVVNQVIGAFFLVRKEIFEQLGGFDERFFVYFEEVDFSYRAKKAGWNSVYLADAQAFHAGGGTSNQVKARRLFYSLRSRLLYSMKHFSLLKVIIVFVSTLLVEPLSRSVLSLFRLSWVELKETWQAYALLWRWLPQWLFKGITR
ncbi:glycosyltransferase family 2 protein [Aeromonas sp. QDB12]|uniref:glycosyltransferase family 2 protein n=1 Tax=Aeromonas sp. QDB12 TaxID=2990483 RepID=UPI0022E602C9|nr:glycosyltransferase family 2 protein [Aeromonas sp. QDB12]